MILCEANIVIGFFSFLFFWLSKPSAAYSSRLTSDILTSTSGFFYMYVKLCYVFQLCFSSWDILLSVGPLLYVKILLFLKTGKEKADIEPTSRDGVNAVQT